MTDPNRRRDPIATATELHERTGWPKTPQQQAELERRRALPFPMDTAAAPELSFADEAQTDDARWLKDFAALHEQSPRRASAVKERWESRVREYKLPLPPHPENVVEYVAECRARVRTHREAYRRTLPHAQELLEEFGSDFGRIRSILDRHQTGCATFAKIERLHEALMAELAKALPAQEPTNHKAASDD